MQITCFLQQNYKKKEDPIRSAKYLGLLNHEFYVVKKNP